jgi:hypothetical protein
MRVEDSLCDWHKIGDERRYRYTDTGHGPNRRDGRTNSELRSDATSLCPSPGDSNLGSSSIKPMPSHWAESSSVSLVTEPIQT